MRRKVVKHGPGTHIISLPSKWVKYFGIQKGDELEVEEEGNKLIVSTSKTQSNISITEDVTGLKPRLVDRFLAQSYQKGYDKLYLIHNDPKILEVIQKKVGELIGYEIVEQNNKTCCIQSIAQKLDLDFEISLRKSFLIIKDMIDIVVKAYTKKDVDALKTLYLRDLEVNRLCYYCLRHINKGHYADPELMQQKHVLYYLVESLENLGDAVKKLSAILSESPKTKNVIAELLTQVLLQFDVSYNFFYAASKEKANKAYELYSEINASIEDCLLSLNKSELLGMIQIADIIHIVYHFTTMRLDFLKSKNPLD